MLRSSSELLGSELQALLSPYKSAACWRESPLLRSFEVKNSELWLQMGPASAVCGELGLPSLERETARLQAEGMTGMTGLRLARKKINK